MRKPVTKIILLSSMLTLASCQWFLNELDLEAETELKPGMNYSQFAWKSTKYPALGPVDVNSTNMILPDGKSMHLLTMKPMKAEKFGGDFATASDEQWEKVVSEFAPDRFCRGNGIEKYTRAFDAGDTTGRVKRIMVECKPA